jgi:glycerol uptake facilitator-like aquaporin
MPAQIKNMSRISSDLSTGQFVNHAGSVAPRWWSTVIPLSNAADEKQKYSSAMPH